MDERQRLELIARARQRAASAQSPAAPGAQRMPEDFGPDDVPSLAFTESLGPAQTVQEQRSPAGRLFDNFVGDDPMRSLQIGTQGALRGTVADTLGMPVDLMTGLLNAGVSLGNLGASAFGYEDPIPHITNPVGGSDWIADRGSDLAEAIGLPVEDPAALEGSERFGYNMNRFGAGALTLGTGLARRAATTAPRTAPSENPFGRMLDGLTDAYRGRGAGRTLSADAAAGMGAGAGLTLAEGVETENPYARAGLDMGAMLAGGLVGAGGVAGANRAFDAGMVGANMTPDPRIPYHVGTTTATSRRIADLAALVVQGQAVDLQAARATLRGRTQAARQAGEPVPTSGIASDDLGLIGIERTLRGEADMQTPFAVRDEAIQRGAAERVQGLRDPGADQAAGLQAARKRPAELRAQRDAATRPLLAQAEASGAVVDTAPVLRRIDEMLAEAKRPAVRDSLEKARGFLNRPGSDELDTSVRGLYETRKAINDLIEGRTDTSTGQYARQELIEVRNLLDEQINAVEPRLGQYIENFRAESAPLDLFRDSRAVARLVENETDMRNVAQRILSGRQYGTEDTMRQITEVFRDNPDGMRAWRAAVSDVLSDRVSQAGGETLNVRELGRVYAQHREALAQIYSPQGMAVLDRANEMLAPLANLSRGARGARTGTAPSDIYGQIEGAMLLSGENAVTTGMVVKRLKVAARTVGLDKWTAEHKTAQVIRMMQFNPELAIHLLERPVSEGVSAAWNQRLINIMAGAQGARSLTGAMEDDDPALEDMIME
jgi:hypothetical protein